MNQRRWGAIFSYINIVLTVIVGLVYTPIMLRLLGQSEYGLYSMIGSLAGYLSVLDMGLGNTIVRYTAKNRIDGSKQREYELNGLFLLVYAIIGLIALFLGFILYINIDFLFGVTLSDIELSRARIMMILLILNVAISFPLSIFASIMQAYERFVFLRISNILRVLINPLLVLPFLYFGYGSVMMVVISTILNIICLLANLYYCWHYLKVKFKIGKYSKSFVHEICSYSFFIFLNAIMDKVYWSSGQFVLGIVSGTISVAVYAIAMQFMMMYMNFSGAISGVMLPKVTMMVANNATVAELSQLFIKIGRLQYLVVGYIFAMFVLVGKSFIELWAGNNYIAAYPMILVLMAALMIALVQNVGISILMAMNLNRYRMTWYSICALLSLGISFQLADIWGGLGCAMATSLSLIISTGFIMNRYYAKKIHLQIKKFWLEIGHLMLITIIFVILGSIINYLLSANVSWSSLLFKIGVYSIIYGMIMYKLGMNSYEKSLCTSALTRHLPRKRGRHGYSKK